MHESIHHPLSQSATHDRMQHKLGMKSYLDDYSTILSKF